MLLLSQSVTYLHIYEYCISIIKCDLLKSIYIYIKNKYIYTNYKLHTHISTLNDALEEPKKNVENVILLKSSNLNNIIIGSNSHSHFM